MRASFGLLCCILLGPIASLASHVHIFTLWSWKPAGQPWHYTLTPYKPDGLYDDAAIIHSREVYIGEAALEERLASLPPNYHGMWLAHPRDSDLRYPPEAVRNRVISFARKHGVHIELSPTFYD